MSFKFGTIVRFGNQKTTGRVIQSNDEESLVHFNDGDRCAVATCYLSEVTA
jgi:hypothetical protein